MYCLPSARRTSCIIKISATRANWPTIQQQWRESMYSMMLGVRGEIPVLSLNLCGVGLIYLLSLACDVFAIELLLDRLLVFLWVFFMLCTFRCDSDRLELPKLICRSRSGYFDAWIFVLSLGYNWMIACLVTDILWRQLSAFMLSKWTEIDAMHKSIV